MLEMQRIKIFRQIMNVSFRSNMYAISSQAITTADYPKRSGEENKSRGGLVAAAFKSLKEGSSTNSESLSTKSHDGQNIKTELESSISNAKTVNGLLSIPDLYGPLSRKHALKVVSVLAEWSAINKVKLSEFENDPRFSKLCRVLGKTIPKSEPSMDQSGAKRISGFRTDDLNTVLGVAGDDEAAKLVSSISMPQMVKVMTTLALKKRRSTPLLRSLAFNISSSTEQLDLKQCADVLYAMAALNFQDSVLSARICADIQIGLSKNIDKSAVVGSILTSLGILKFRDNDIMEAITNWILKNNDICRPQDLRAFILSSAVLNFKSIYLEEVEKKIIRVIVPEDFRKKNDWLNYVWALSILGLVKNEHISNILNGEFINLLDTQQSLTATAKMKILNLNGYAKLLAKDYSGPFITEDMAFNDVPMTHCKSKLVLVNGMMDAVKSLLPQNNHIKSLVDSKMGFLIDAVCHFDKKRNPVPLDNITPEITRVAMMTIDFHDVCQGTNRSSSGVTNLYFDLLEKLGYTIIPIPYTEFNTSDKLLKRVQYIEKKFKSITNEKV